MISRSSNVNLGTQENCALVRTDAAWSEVSKIAGLGWTVQNGNRTSPFSAPSTFVGSPLVAKGLAMREAVLKCRDLGLLRIHCESDSAHFIKSLTLDFTYAELYGIVEDIKYVALSFDFISFTWISRERNSVAYGLAKQVLSAELVSPNFGY